MHELYRVSRRPYLIAARPPDLAFNFLRTDYGRALIRLRLHVGAQNGVNTGLVATALFPEPFHNIMVNPDGQAVLGLRHGELRGFPERLTQLGNIGVIDVRITHLAQASKVSLA